MVLIVLFALFILAGIKKFVFTPDGLNCLSRKKFLDCASACLQVGGAFIIVDKEGI